MIVVRAVAVERPPSRVKQVLRMVGTAVVAEEAGTTTTTILTPMTALGAAELSILTQNLTVVQMGVVVMEEDPVVTVVGLGLTTTIQPSITVTSTLIVGPWILTLMNLTAVQAALVETVRGTVIAAAVVAVQLSSTTTTIHMAAVQMMKTTVALTDHVEVESTSTKLQSLYTITLTATSLLCIVQRLNKLSLLYTRLQAAVTSRLHRQRPVISHLLLHVCARPATLPLRWLTPFK
jgi:hypothetical protein